MRARLWREHAQFAALAAVLAAGVILVISRRPDAFVRPQFYAEDGLKWWSDAYNHGALRALTFAYEGYYQVLSRAIAALEIPFGPLHAPLVGNICGLIVQVAPALFLVSGRFEPLIPSLRNRILLAVIYLLLPASELNITPTAAQFHLAVLAFLVVLAPAPRRRGWLAFDVVVLGFAALTGPFVYILIVMAGIWLILRRHRHTLVHLAPLLVGLILQLYAYTHSVRQSFPLGANLRDLVLIVSDRIVIPSLFAEDGPMQVHVSGAAHAFLLAAVIAAAAAAAGLVTLLRGPVELRFFAGAAALVVAGGLVNPLVSPNGHQWDVLALTRGAGRYFFAAELAWLVVVIWLLTRIRLVWLRRIGLGAMAAAFASGLVLNWRYPALVDDHWPAEAQRILTAAPGTFLRLPIPPAPPWAVEITVHR